MTTVEAQVVSASPPQDRKQLVAPRSSMDLEVPTRAMLQKRQAILDVINDLLIEGQDYGPVPGTGKKMLFTQGGSKILSAFGLRAEAEYVEARCREDYDDGFFDYTIRVRLYSGETLVGEGLRSCNTREKGKSYQSSYDSKDTCLAVAQKRARIDAIRRVFGLEAQFEGDTADAPAIRQAKADKKKAAVDARQAAGTEQVKKKVSAQVAYLTGRFKMTPAELELADMMVREALGDVVSWDEYPPDQIEKIQPAYRDDKMISEVLKGRENSSSKAQNGSVGMPQQEPVSGNTSVPAETEPSGPGNQTTEEPGSLNGDTGSPVV
jgi:hypothetical protein